MSSPPTDRPFPPQPPKQGTDTRQDATVQRYLRLLGLPTDAYATSDDDSTGYGF